MTRCPAYPRRYTADRICPGCALLVPVEVVVMDPWTIGYRCGRGHKWLATRQTNLISSSKRISSRT